MNKIKTKNYGDAVILSDGVKYNYLKVMFCNTGNVGEFRKDAVKKGEIRDKYAISLCGVGIIGNIKTRGKYKLAYELWHNMITRCYSNKNVAYYGKVIVCDKWKTFENFYSDLHTIDGWDENMFNLRNIVLDKDIKQRFSSVKVYSANTCTWVAQSINANIQDEQQKKFVAISPTGEEYIETNITAFAKMHNLERRQISAVLHNRFKSTMGWQFHYDEEIV